MSRYTSAGGSASVSLRERVFVTNSGDFPAATMVGGVLTHVLENKEYLIDGNVSIANPIGFPGAGNTATLRAVNRSILTYTGTDACFRDVDALGNIEVEGLTEFQAPSGDMWDITGIAGPFSFQAGGGACRFTNCNALGTVDGNGNGGFNLFFGTLSDFDQGLIVTDTFFFEINTMFCFGNNVASCVYFTVNGTATTGSVNMFNNTFNNGTNETAWDFNSSIESTVDGIQLVNNFQEGGINGTIFKAGSLDTDTPILLSVANGFIPDTKPDALLCFINNATATTIAVVDTPVLVAGTWTIERESLFTSTTAGKMTYDGLNNLVAPITASFSSQVDGGGQTDTVSFYVFKNGTEITNSKATSDQSSTGFVRTTLVWQDELATGDFIEFFVENNDDTSDILVQDACIRIN